MDRTWPPQGGGKEEGSQRKGSNNRAGKEERPFSVKIDRVQIKNGTLDIRDEKTGEPPLSFISRIWIWTWRRFNTHSFPLILLSNLKKIERSQRKRGVFI